MRTIHLSGFISWGDVIVKLFTKNAYLVSTRKKKILSIVHRPRMTQIYVEDFIF